LESCCVGRVSVALDCIIRRLIPLGAVSNIQYAAYSIFFVLSYWNKRRTMLTTTIHAATQAYTIMRLKWMRWPSHI
jgi:hypothetical protein